MPAQIKSVLESAPSSSPQGLPNASEAQQVKPCCVCKDEKAARDECMLFSKSDDPQRDCQSMVDQYRSCMKGYGFTT